LKLITWNVAGRVKMLSRQIEYLAAHQPDIVTLQEVTKTTAPLFKGLLPSLGLKHIVCSIDFVIDSSSLKGPRRYGLLIASKWDLSNPKIGGELITWPERFLSVTVETPHLPIKIHTTHIPPGSSNGWIKIEMLEGIFQTLVTENYPYRILSGDFNMPQEELPTGEVITWAYKKNSKGEYIPGRRNERWDQGERNIIIGLKEHDLEDVYRRLYGYSKEGFSWLLKMKEKTWKRRFDHVFASNDLHPVHAEYQHDARIEKASDHAILEVMFDIKDHTNKREEI
jgi:exonuclease III